MKTDPNDLKLNGQCNKLPIQLFLHLPLPDPLHPLLLSQLILLKFISFYDDMCIREMCIIASFYCFGDRLKTDTLTLNFATSQSSLTLSRYKYNEILNIWKMVLIIWRNIQQRKRLTSWSFSSAAWKAASCSAFSTLSWYNFFLALASSSFWDLNSAGLLEWKNYHRPDYSTAFTPKDKELPHEKNVGIYVGWRGHIGLGDDRHKSPTRKFARWFTW